MLVISVIFWEIARVLQLYLWSLIMTCPMEDSVVQDCIDYSFDKLFESEQGGCISCGPIIKHKVIVY